MFRIFVFIILFISPQIAFSQYSKSAIDSLHTLLSNAKEEDKVGILIELSEETRLEEKGFDYANEALDLAKIINDPVLIADALFAIGRYYYVNFFEDEALKYFFESLEIYSSQKIAASIIRTKRIIGKTYFYLDSIEKSESYTLQSLQLAREANDKIQIAEALIDYGELFAKQYECEKAIIKLHESLSIFEEHGTKQELYRAYNSLGKIYFDCGDYQHSIEAYLKEIGIRESINDIRGVALSRHNLGRTHRTIGNFQLALEQFQLSLTSSEIINDREFIAANNSEIGNTYENLSRSQLAVEDNEVNFRRALDFHETALRIYQEDNNSIRAAQSLNNIANCYSRLAVNQFVAQYGEQWEDSLYKLSPSVILSTFGKTFDYYKKTLEVSQEINDPWMAANVNINLGSHYIFVRNWQKAREHLNEGLRLARELNSQYEISLAYFHMGEGSFRQGNLEAAESNLLRSFQIADRLGVKDVLMHIHNKLSKIYEAKGQLASALKHIKIYNHIKDDIFSEESQKIITEMQTKYETEKKEQEILLLNNEKALQRSVIQRQRLMIILSVGGIIVILAFAGLLVNMVRQKQRANKILEEKNELISHQKQEITDSIRYASRIQNAILPSTNLIKESLKEHFVLFLPRDIVSGDFFWFTKQHGKMVIVAADCTGHGVPGAFMSMLGVSFLYEIVNKEGIMEPAKILNTLREFVKLTLSQTGKKDEQKDGMDISLCTLDLNNMKLEWAGAYNPLVLIRKGELIEYKADKMPVAIHITDHKPFTNHEIDLEPGDTFYMYSDGFPDQFGGTDGRKYMSKRFKELLININSLPMEDQKEILFKEFHEWRGDYDPIDDVVVIGVRV